MASTSALTRSDRTPFDMWLQRDLSHQFGEALREPLPEELLRLLS